MQSVNHHSQKEKIQIMMMRGNKKDNLESMNTAKHEGKQMSDKELVEGCIAGKNKCQEALYKRFAGAMMTVCLRYFKLEVEAEDALQEAFIKIFLNLRHFKFESTLGYWIKRVTINTVLSKIHRKKTEGVGIEVSEYEEDIPYVTVEKDPVVPMNVLMEMIQDLPNGYRMVFNMREIDGYELQEIADKMQCSNITVRTQLFKAKNKLKENIEDWLKGEYK